MSNEKLVEALKHCLGWMTGGMDGIWDDKSDPVDMARQALAEYERPRKTTATGMPERIYLRDDRYTSGNFIVSLTNRSSANPDFVYDHMVEYVRADTAYRHSAHSKSEYKRLKALGVDVVEPFTPYVTGPDEFGSVYVYFQPNRKGAVYGTHGKAPVTVNVDYDHEGNLYGIEILGVNAPPPPTAATEG